MYKYLTRACALMLLVSGCNLGKPSAPQAAEIGTQPVASVGTALDTRRKDTAGIRREYETKGYPEIPVTTNPRVEHFVNFYSVKHRKGLKEDIQRCVAQRATVESVLKKHGLPRDLINVALIESGFKPHVSSSMGPAGIWQLMKETATKYGLQIGAKADERKDLGKSTEAVAQYFMDLYEEYGDWYLALGAYNAGTGKMNRAIAAAGSRDYFEICRRGFLKQETADFVPKVLALIKISKSGGELAC